MKLAAAAQEGAFDAACDGSLRHRAVIELFGRFLHRNAIRRRGSAPTEIKALKQPGFLF